MGQHLNWTGKPKVAHSSLEEAEKHRRAIQPKINQPVEVYPCGNHWHVGRVPREDRIKSYLKPGAAREERLVGRLIAALKDTINSKDTKGDS